MKYKLKLDYTEDELKELKELSKTCDSPMTTVRRVVGTGDCNGPFRNLWEKYSILDNHKDFDFMADINNVVMGTAIFPEEKYIVHDKATDQYIYYNVVARGKLHWWTLGAKTAEEKTKEEWLEINPAYEAMLEKVED